MTAKAFRGKHGVKLYNISSLYVPWQMQRKFISSNMCNHFYLITCRCSVWLCARSSIFSGSCRDPSLLQAHFHSFTCLYESEGAA